MKGFLRRHQLTIIGVLVGAIGGYLYYHFVGCNSGTCAITSKPLNSTLYGALMGGLFFNIFKKEKKIQSNES
jgi:LytS/YehU family sensor histidine kinase